MCYIIATIKNNELYYLVEIKEGGGRVWTKTKYSAKSFNARGGAEYYATSSGVTDFLIKKL